MCKISKTSGTRILRYQRYGRTDEQTDEAEFIGPFRLKPWIQKILPYIISEEQNCSIPQRTIFNNLFLIKKKKNSQFYILQIDQAKAFDKIDHKFLFKTMEKMGFTKTFINFIKILYKNFFLTSSTLNKGLRQGCPLSLILYVVQGEITTTHINQDKNTKRIKIPNKKKKK